MVEPVDKWVEKRHRFRRLKGCLAGCYYTIFFMFFRKALLKEMLRAFAEYFPNFQSVGGVEIIQATEKYYYFWVKYNERNYWIDHPPYQVLAYSRRLNRVMLPHTRLDKMFNKRRSAIIPQIDPKDYPTRKSVSVR